MRRLLGVLALNAVPASGAPLAPPPAWHPAVRDVPAPGRAGGRACCCLSPHGWRGIERDRVDRVAGWLGF